MKEIRMRAAVRADLARLTEIYNYYVVNTPVTFDVEPYTVERRQAWFAQFGAAGRYRLLVAEGDAGVVGYAGTTRFRPKAAYDTTVETTVLLRAGGGGLWDWEASVCGIVRGSARRGYSSLCCGIRIAESGDGSTARQVWV
jgi:hypothetical protein